MNQDPQTLYKLIVLYMLDRVDFPLTKAQIGDFILEKGYTNFLVLQQIISELIDKEMIISQTYRNRTHLTLTQEGRDTLSFFEKRISDSVREEVDAYLLERKMELRNDVSVYADYEKTAGGDYNTRMIAKEKDTVLVEVHLSVPTEEAAIAVCEKWMKKNQEVYQYLITNLF